MLTPHELRLSQERRDAAILLDCGPDELALRRRLREADAKRRVSERLRERRTNLSPASKAKMAAWQAERDDPEYAAWIAAGAPDPLEDLIAKRKTERETAL